MTDYRTYLVRMTFEFPAWDEREGITYEVTASSKAQANRFARRQANDDGHMGRRYFQAKLVTGEEG